MQTVTDLIDTARKALNVNSDAEFARQLGVSRGTIANWKSGYSLPDTVMCATLAGLTGLPLARVLGIVGEARAISREEKAVWRKLAATAMALCLAVGLALPSQAHAATHAAAHMGAQAFDVATLYTLCAIGSGSGQRSFRPASTASVSVFPVLVLLIRIAPLLDFIGNSEATKDKILNMWVPAVAVFNPVPNGSAECIKSYLQSELLPRCTALTTNRDFDHP